MKNTFLVALFVISLSVPAYVSAREKQTLTPRCMSAVALSISELSDAVKLKRPGEIAQYLSGSYVRLECSEKGAFIRVSFVKTEGDETRIKDGEDSFLVDISRWKVVEKWIDSGGWIDPDYAREPGIRHDDD
jgi:hypothetical protein